MTTQENPNKIRLVYGFIFFLVVFAMSPTMYEWNARGRIHADRFFELVHNFPTDYNLYLSKIRLGKEGAWLAREKYTSEPHSGSLSQIMYVLIGRLAHWSHVQTPFVWFAYHTARVFFAATLLWVIWKVSEWVMGKQAFVWQFLTFLLISTQSTWPKFESVLGIPRLGGWMPWYTQADSLQRTTFMPHVLFSQMLMVFILWVFSGGFITRKHPGNAVFLGLVGLVLGIIFPPGLMFTIVVLGLVTAWEFLQIWWTKGLGGKGVLVSDMKKWFAASLFDRLVFGIITAPSAIYYTLLLGQYPWKRLVEFDVLHPTKFSFVEYFMAVGPLMPLGILGVVVLALLGKWGILGKLKYFVAWIISWLVLLFIFDKIPQQSPTRFTQMIPQVPLGIFTGLLFWESVKRFQKFKYVLYAVPAIIILFAFGSMASSYMWLQDFVDHKLRATIPLVPHNAEVMYPMKDIAEGLVWLQVYTPRSAVVLTGTATGNYVPVYSGNTAFLGHANTVELEIKQAAMGNFYNNRLGEEVEMNWIKDQKIDYIFYSHEERDMNGGIEDLRTYYPSLTVAYDTPTVKIYKAP